VRRRRNPALGRQHGEERLDLGGRHVPRMPQAMPTNEEAYPVNVCFLGAQAVVQVASPLADLVHEARSWRRELVAGFHSRFILYARTVISGLPAPALAGRLAATS
jgi:hypothetical protein